MTPLRRNPTRLALLIALASFAALLTAGPASATPCKTNPAQQCSPWWNLNTSLRPATIPAGGEGTIVARAANLGDAPTSGPVTLSATLPEGLEIVAKEGVPQVSFFSLAFGGGVEDLGLTGGFGFLHLCKVLGSKVTCTTEASIEIGPGEFFHPEIGSPLAPYEYAEIKVEVKDQSVSPGDLYAARVSGGGAPPVARQRPLPVGSAPSFGVEDLSLLPEDAVGGIDTRAAGHPFQLTTTFNLNQAENPFKPPALPKDIRFNLPPGQLGNATVAARCASADFSVTIEGSFNTCPASSAIGAAIVTVALSKEEEGAAQSSVHTYPVPLFNLEPKLGEPARFGFEVLGTPVILDTALRSGNGEDYGVTVSVNNVTQAANFLSSTVTFWGAPGDSRHDSSRGWACLAGQYWVTAGHHEEASQPCEASGQPKPPSFLTLPADCATPFATTVEGVSWPSKESPAGTPLDPLGYSLEDPSGAPLSLTGCNQVPFAPEVEAEPTSNAATSPTGLNFDLNIDGTGLENAEGLAQSEIKKAVVTLPEGFTTNPSVAEGLKACSLASYESATAEAGTGCPDESKIGDVEIESPLVEPVVHGSLYVAKQGENPNHNLLTIYMIARNPEIGVLVKQAGKVEANKVTGQLVTTFGTETEPIPELPFSHFRLSFRQGQRSPLITPPTCGTYTVKALLYPWARPSEPIEESKSFQITQGPEGQGCPSGGVPPFHPNLLAGSTNPTAGTYSPFNTRITRKDSEQEITHFSIKLPPGEIGKLAGIPFCSEAGILQAEEREHEGGGGEELAAPSCPQASEIGRTNVGTGVGNVLAYAPGKLYLAGPYHGSAISIVSVTAAKVGPFDLGTVVVREALRVNPETAEVFVDATGSDPIPHIVDGIPVHIRDIQVFVDRPEFTLNPTSCEKTSTASTVLGSGLNFASEADDQPVTVTSPFQVGSCASLPFHPTLKLRLRGGTKRGATPAFKATLTYPKGGAYANIAKSVVTLPHSEFLEQGHIGTVCTRAQFKEGTVPGEKCPAASVYGRARAVTPIFDEALEGPVYLRSSSHQLPDLVAALHNKQVDIDLDGRIDSIKGGRIRNTFERVPDAPVSKFVLEMQGGRKGLLVNSTNLCAHTNRAISEFTGQNGKIYNTDPVLQAKCGKKGKKAHQHQGAHR